MIMPDAPGTINCEMTRELAENTRRPVVRSVGKIEAGPYKNFDSNERIPLDGLVAASQTNVLNS